MSKEDQNGKSPDTYWWGKASKHSKMRCYITAWDVFLSFLGDSEMFLVFALKGLMSWGYGSQCIFRSILCWSHCLVPFTKCLTCRVTKKISNKLHQRALSMIIFYWFLQRQRIWTWKVGPTFQVSVHVTCSPFKVVVYYIDTSVLLENIPLVKFIKTTSGTRVGYFP